MRMKFSHLYRWNNFLLWELIIKLLKIFMVIDHKNVFIIFFTETLYLRMSFLRKGFNYKNERSQYHTSSKDKAMIKITNK